MVHSVLPLTYLSPRLILSPNWPKWASTWHMSPRSTIGCAQNAFHASGTFGTNRAPILHRDQHYLQTDWNELPHTLHKSTIGCNQSDFHSRGTFGANHASFLHRYQNFLQTDRKELLLKWDIGHQVNYSGKSRVCQEPHVLGGPLTALWPYHRAPVSDHTYSGTVCCRQSTRPE
jgi:hypothetical protein